MKINKSNLEKLEKRTKLVINDPEKIIHLINKAIHLICYEDGLPVPEELKITYQEFVQYFANPDIQRTKDNGWNLEERKKEMLEYENRIRKIDGFSDTKLPDDLIIEYKQ